MGRFEELGPLRGDRESPVWDGVTVWELELLGELLDQGLAKSAWKKNLPKIGISETPVRKSERDRQWKNDPRMPTPVLGDRLGE